MKLAAEGPDSCVQVPVPELTAVAAIVVEVTLQSDWLGPALEGVTACATVMATLLEYWAAQLPLCTCALKRVVAVRLL